MTTKSYWCYRKAIEQRVAREKAEKKAKRAARAKGIAQVLSVRRAA